MLEIWFKTNGIYYRMMYHYYRWMYIKSQNKMNTFSSKILYYKKQMNYHAVMNRNMSVWEDKEEDGKQY